MDVVLTGGTVVDPVQDLGHVVEVGIRGEHIAAIGLDLPRSRHTQVLDCRGQYVVPGLIDLHVHTYPGMTGLGLDPDRLMYHGGVTTLVDAGSAGASTWAGLRDSVITPAHARVLAYVHLCSTGLAAFHRGELLNPHLSDPEGASRIIAEEPSLAVGVKIRAGVHLIGDGEQGWRHFRQAVRAARDADSSLMVHIGNTPMPLSELVAELRPGDVVTHCYKGGPFHHRVLDEQERVYPALLRAADDGIAFDVGHGGGSFSWDVAQRAIDQGLFPSTISTDLHADSVAGPVFDLPTTMTKLHLLGLSLSEVVERSTIRPARLIGREAEIGHLSPGACADVTVLRWQEEPIELHDSYGNVRLADRRLVATGVIRAGRIWRNPQAA